MPSTAAFGSWKSPITTDALVEHVVSLSFPLLDGEDTYWCEGRPSQGGRQTIMVHHGDGSTEELLAKEYSARTLVHEYGGLSYAVGRGVVYFANFADQRLYRRSRDGRVEAITAAPPSPMAVRYAAPVLAPDQTRLVCVREQHVGDEVVNDLVAIATDASTDPIELAAGHDFYAAPAFSPDGSRLAFVCWDHPLMPWDGTFLYEAALERDGRLGPARLVAGGPSESVTQPRYAADGTLHFISDRSGWWNLYRDDHAGGALLVERAAAFATPDWVFGLSSYAFFGDDVVCTWSEYGLGHLGRYRAGESELCELSLDYDQYGGLQALGGRMVAIAGSARHSPVLLEVDVENEDLRVLARSRAQSVDTAYLSVPEPISFATSGGRIAHGLYYRPTNPDFHGPEGERPPLIVASHGGPTSAAQTMLSYQIQYWTSRGFGLVDVNYGGSSGYGRDYRRQLDGAWGIVDVDDCVAAARYLAERGEVDPQRLVIHGGSAGGYTTLCALTFRSDFAAGASYYGVADAGALARDTHKFESRYLDRLIGPWPDARALYEERSPIFHVEQLATPLILFQGLEDKIVPPNQAETMRDALAKGGTPVAYLAYEGEQHGFRRAENIKRTAEAELYFYGKVLGFTPADDIAPVEIENL